MIIGVGIILGTIAAVLAAYFGSRLVLGADPEDRTRDLAASVLFRVAALHGLVLALVFASEVVEYHSLAFESASEVNAISDIYYDSERYGDEASDIRDALKKYLQIVHSEEWRTLGEEGKLSPDAWAQWDAAYSIVLDLVPDSPRQVSLRDNRDLREHHAKTELNSMFWAAALVGVLLISVGYYSFPPKRANLALISVFAAYTGLILFTIYAMSNPFSAPAALQPILFVELFKELAN